MRHRSGETLFRLRLTSEKYSTSRWIKLGGSYQQGVWGLHQVHDSALKLSTHSVLLGLEAVASGPHQAEGALLDEVRVEYASPAFVPNIPPSECSRGVEDRSEERCARAFTSSQR
jgi:hypothetical protein